MQMPSDTDRTEGMASVTIRAPIEFGEPVRVAQPGRS